MSPTPQSNHQYIDQRFEDIKLDGTRVLDTEFHQCVFHRCTFKESVFKNCRFVECSFKECDFSLSRIPECLFSSSHFMDCKLIGVNWAVVNLEVGKIHPHFRFEGCKLDHSTFIGLQLTEIQIKDCSAIDVDFREANLSKADLSGTDFSDSLFLDTDLSGADLRTARNYHIPPKQNQLRGAKFTLPEALALLYALEIELGD